MVTFSGICYTATMIFWPERYRDDIRAVLNHALPILNRNNIRYWLTDGTLLGCHREGDVILGDSDADIMVLHDDYHRACSLFMTDDSPPWVTLEQTVNPANGGDTAYITLGRGRVDVFCARVTGDRVQYMDGGRSFDFARDTVFPLRTVPFLQTQTFIPADTPTVLQAIYGDDYMTPRIGFKGPHVRYMLGNIPPRTVHRFLTSESTSMSRGSIPNSLAV